MHLPILRFLLGVGGVVWCMQAAMVYMRGFEIHTMILTLGACKVLLLFASTWFLPPSPRAYAVLLNMYIATCAMGITGVALVSGREESSTLLYWVAVLALSAFHFNRRETVMWFVVSLASVVGVYLSPLWFSVPTETMSTGVWGVVDLLFVLFVLCAVLLAANASTRKNLVLLQERERTIINQTSELTHASKRLGAIVNNIFDALLVLDHEGEISTSNIAASDLFGWSRRELAGRALLDLIDGRDRSVVEGVVDAWLSLRGDARFDEVLELRIVDTQGEEKICECVFTPVEIDDQRCMIVALRDITERKQVDRMKDEFVSTVSHELRTPLTSIRGGLGLVHGGVMGEIPQKASDLLGLALNNTERLMSLINDILDLNKLRSGILSMQIRPLDLTEVLQESMRSMRGAADHAGVVLSFMRPELQDPPEHRAFTSIGDPDRLIQVFNNLISNAVKFSPKGSTVELYVMYTPEGRLRAYVRDHGKGIAVEDRERVFERFQQLDGSDRRSQGGTGLGLAICSAIVGQHGGSIGVEDPKEGKGAAFWVELRSYDPASLGLDMPKTAS